jgi:hypothetical protein
MLHHLYALILTLSAAQASPQSVIDNVIYVAQVLSELSSMGVARGERKQALLDVSVSLYLHLPYAA